MNILLILAIFWPALAGLVIFLMPSCKDNRQLRGRAVNAALAVELALTLIMCLGQGTNMVLLNMTPTLRIEMNVDMVGCIFAVLMSAMWLLSSVFAREYMGHDDNERLYQVFFMCVLSALIGQCYAGSMVTLYVFYELMTLLSVPMVVHERTPQAVAALHETTADFAVVTTPAALSPSLTQTRVRPIQEVPICAPEFSVLLDRTVTLADLAAHPLITLGAGTTSHDFYARLNWTSRCRRVRSASSNARAIRSASPPGSWSGCCWPPARNNARAARCAVRIL